MVRPTGPQLGQRGSGIIAEECRAAIAGHGSELRHVVIDLSDIRRMSSLGLGLGLCIELRNAADQYRASCIVLKLSSEHQDLFRLMKLDRLFTIVQTVQDLARTVLADHAVRGR